MNAMSSAYAHIFNTHIHTDKMWDVPFVSLLPLYAGVIVFLCTAVV